MADALDIDALGRRDLAGLVRLAARAGVYLPDAADVARVRLDAACEAERTSRENWERAHAQKRDAEREAEARQDQPFRRSEFTAAVNRLRAASDLSGTLFKIWKRAAAKTAAARKEYDDAMTTRTSGAVSSEAAAGRDVRTVPSKKDYAA